MTDAILPPYPEETALTSFYWEALRHGRLELLRCGACGHFVHFPKVACDRCQHTDLAPQEISGRGTLYGYTTVVQPGHPFFVEQVPYLLGIVEIEEEAGVRIPAGLVDCDEGDLRCGLAMEATYRSVAPDLTLVYFRPVEVAP